jgi:hypothetical protein
MTTAAVQGSTVTAPASASGRTPAKRARPVKRVVAAAVGRGVENGRLPAELVGEPGERHAVAPGAGDQQADRRHDRLAQQHLLPEHRHDLAGSAVARDGFEGVERRRPFGPVRGAVRGAQ